VVVVQAWWWWKVVQGRYDVADVEVLLEQGQPMHFAEP